MKRKGFTLIELLAVILILGIIALIAIPTVNDIIKESKMGAFKSAVQNIVTAVENKCQIERMKGEIVTKQYVFNEDGVTPKLEIKGSLPTSGSIALNNDCEVVVSVSDGINTVKKNLINDDFAITEGDNSFDDIIVPTKRDVKRIERYITIGQQVEAFKNDSFHFNDAELENIISTTSAIAIDFAFNSDNEIIDLYSLMYMNNTFTNELANNYAIRLAEKMKELTETSFWSYYVTDKNIILVLSELSSMITANEMYEEFSTENVSGYEHVTIEY